MLKTKLIITMIIALALPMASNASEDSLRYNVKRNGSSIGTHEVSFERKGDLLEVEIETDIEVKVAFITFYRFDHKAEEQWKNGQLVAYHSKTNDNGTDKFLNLSSVQGNYIVAGSAGRFETNSLALPASLWHQTTPKQDLLMNTLDGHNMKVEITDAGMDMVMASGESIEARHYIMQGELQRELWYENGKLVHLKFLGEDASTIEYELQ